jgi:hypothetical protein
MLTFFLVSSEFKERIVIFFIQWDPIFMELMHACIFYDQIVNFLAIWIYEQDFLLLSQLAHNYWHLLVILCKYHLLHNKYSLYLLPNVHIIHPVLTCFFFCTSRAASFFSTHFFYTTRVTCFFSKDLVMALGFFSIINYEGFSL